VTCRSPRLTGRKTSDGPPRWLASSQGLDDRAGPVISPSGIGRRRDGSSERIASSRSMSRHRSRSARCATRRVPYRKARAGEIEELTGTSSPYEPPEHAFLPLDTTGRTVEACVEELLVR